MGDVDTVEHVLRDESIEVRESVEYSVKYYKNNTLATYGWFEAMRRVGVKKLVFFSTAAACGIPEFLPIDEIMKTLMVE